MVEENDNVDGNDEKNMDDYGNHQEDVNQNDGQSADAKCDYNNNNIVHEKGHYANIFDSMFNEQFFCQTSTVLIIIVPFLEILPSLSI